MAKSFNTFKNFTNVPSVNALLDTCLDILSQGEATESAKVIADHVQTSVFVHVYVYIYIHTSVYVMYIYDICACICIYLIYNIYAYTFI